MSGGGFECEESVGWIVKTKIRDFVNVWDYLKGSTRPPLFCTVNEDLSAHALIFHIAAE